MSFFGKNRQICAQRAFPGLRGRNMPGGGQSSVSACARDLDISRPTARKWKPEQAEPTKKPGKLSRILNILKE